MQSVTFQNIPEYLHISPRYKTLARTGSGSAIEVPVGCLKQDTLIYNPSDFHQFLQTIDFWQVPELALTTASLYYFALSPSHRGSVRTSIEEFEEQIPQLKVLQILIESPNHLRLERAAQHGVYDAIQYLVEEVGVQVNVDAVVAAAAGNHVHCMRYLLGKNREPRKTTYISKVAAEHGHLECLQCCVEFDCRMDEHTTAAAAQSGSLECLQFLSAHYCDWDVRTPRYVAYYGHLNCLEFACERFGPWQHPDTDFYSTFNDVPECEGQVECLHFMLAQGYEVTSSTLEIYARRGHNRTLKFLLRNSVPPDALPSALRAAVRLSRTETVEMLVEYMTPQMRAKCKVCEIAVTLHDKVEFLLFFMTNGFPCDLSTMNAAAHAGNVEAVSFLHDNGCAWDVTTTAAAAGRDELICLTFLHDNGCPWDASTCTAAFEHDSPECLAYALSSGCPHDLDMSLQAVLRGKAQCLRCLIDNDLLKLSADLTEMAARRAVPDILSFLHDKGCPWDERTCSAASACQRWECFNYAYDNGCPCEMNINIKSHMYMQMRTPIEDLATEDHTVREAAVRDMITIAAQHPTALYVRFVRDIGLPWSELFTTTAAMRGSPVCLRYALDHGCPAPADLATIAAEHGQRDCLEVAVEHGFTLTSNVCSRMAKKQNMTCLTRVLELGGHLDVSTATAAASRGDLSNLQFLHKKEVAWNEDTFRAGITQGSLECVQYMFDHNCPLDFMNSVTLAARYGHLRLIKYLRERRLPWNTATCAAAAEGGHLDCLSYAAENGCPWDAETTLLASTQECFDYAVLMGCPVSKKNTHKFQVSG